MAASLLLLALIMTPMGVAGCAVGDNAPAPQATQQLTQAEAEAADAALEAAAEAAFRKFDINEDGELTGSELTACRCLAYDISGGRNGGGDGVVSKVEFVSMDFFARKEQQYEQTKSPVAARSSAAPAATTSKAATAAPETPRAGLTGGGKVVSEPPLSRAELLALLRSMPGSQDYSVPYEQRKAAIQKQVRIIETRGIDFRYDMGKFDRELYEAGISTDVMVALSRNYRAAGSAPRVIEGNNALIGSYGMGIAGSTTRYDRSGSNVVRTDRDVGFAGGGLVISANGRYEWRLLSTPDPKYTFRGNWRPATDAETGSYVGPAIVLTNSYEGANWIVTRYESTTPGEHIRVQRIDQRFRSYLGTRKP